MKAVVKFVGLVASFLGLQGCLVEVDGEVSRPRADCEFGCDKVPVKISYLVENHGSWDGENRITIEAFENDRFSGDALASTEVVTRSAASNGETTLYLMPGEYCIRGYARRRAVSPSSCTFDIHRRDFTLACSEGGVRYESRSFVQCISVEPDAHEHEVQVEIEVEE